MIDAEALHEAEQQALGQLGQMDLSLAKHLHGLALSTEDTKEIIDFARAYQRASRCVRQTIMLRARLRHDRERCVAGLQGRAPFAPLFKDDDAPDPVEARVDARILDLQEAASRIVAQAAPPGTPRAERLDGLDRIDAWIDREVEERPDFGLEPLDDHVLALCRAFKLPEDLGRRHRDLPRAPREDDDTDPGHTLEAKRRRRETG